LKRERGKERNRVHEREGREGKGEGARGGKGSRCTWL
jgi:hypothetical protein